MPKLVYVLDVDGIWKVVPLQDDNSFGYIVPIRHTVLTAANNFGFILENDSSNEYRVLCYSTTHKQVFSQTNSAGITANFDYFELAELIPFVDADQVIVSQVGWVLTEQESMNALVAWQIVNSTPYSMQPMIMVSEEQYNNAIYAIQSANIAAQQSQLTAQQLQLENRMLQAQLTTTRKAAARSVRYQQRSFRIISSPSSLASYPSDDRISELNVSATTSPRFASTSDSIADETSPRFKPKEFTDKPSITVNNQNLSDVTSTQSVVDSIDKSAAVTQTELLSVINEQSVAQSKAAAKKMRQQEQEKLKIEAQAVLAEALATTDVKQIYLALTNNNYIKMLDSNRLLELLVSNNLTSKVCIELLVHIHKIKDKKNSKLHVSLFKKLNEYTKEELQNCEIPQVVVTVASELFKENDDILRNIKKLAAEFRPAVKAKPVIFTVSQDTSVVSDVSVIDVSKATSKPMPKQTIVKLNPMEEITAAINTYNYEKFNVLIVNHAGLIDDVTIVLLEKLRSDKDKIEAFFNLINLPAQSHIDLIKSLSKNKSEYVLANLVLRKTLNLSSLDIVIIFSALEQHASSLSYLESLKDDDIEQFQNYVNRIFAAKDAVLDNLTMRLSKNEAGILKEINKFPLLIDSVNTTKQSLLMIALSNSQIPTDTVLVLLDKTNLAIDTQDKSDYNALDYWAEYRSDKDKDFAIFKPLCEKFAKALSKNIRAHLNLKEHEKLTPGAEVSKLFHRMLTVNSSGKTFVHRFIEKTKDLDRIVTMLNMLKVYFWENVGLLMLVKDHQYRKNTYNILESRLLEMSVAECEAFPEKINMLLDLLKDVREFSFNRRATGLLPPNYFTNDLLDFFNMEQSQSIILNLLTKLPDPKAKIRLQTLMKMRAMIRGDIDVGWYCRRTSFSLKIPSDRNFVKYYGLHDLHLEIMELLHVDEDLKAEQAIRNWLTIEPEQHNGSLLYATLFDLCVSLGQKHLDHENNDSVMITSNKKILDLILNSDKKLVDKALIYTSDIDQNCLHKAIHIVSVDKESDYALKLFKQVISKVSDTIINARTLDGCNFMHAIANLYAGKKCSSKTLEIIRNHVPMKVLVELLKQKNNEKQVPLHAGLVSSSDVIKMRAEFIDVLFQPEYLKSVMASMENSEQTKSQVRLKPAP